MGRFISALLALVALRFATSLLSPAEYGEYALLLAVQGFCGLLLINPVSQHISLNTHKWWDEGTLASRLKHFRRYVFLVAILGGGLVILMGLHQLKVELFATSVILTFMVVASTWNAMLIWMLNMLGFSIQAVTLTVFTSFISIIFSVSLTYWWQSSAAWLFGQAIGMLSGALAAHSILYRQPQYFIKTCTNVFLLDKKTVLTYCIPLSIATGMMWLQLSGYRFLIEVLWGLSQLGLMAIGLQVANQIFGMAESIAMQFLYPKFYRHINEHNDIVAASHVYSDLLNILGPLYILLAGLVVMVAPYLLKILVATQYHDAISFIMLGAIIELCRVLANLLSNASQLTLKTNSLITPYLVGSIITFVLIVLSGILNMQIQVGGIALALGAFAMLIIMWRRMKSEVNLKIDLAQWLFAAVTMLTMSLSATWLPREVDFLTGVGILAIGAIITAVIAITLLLKCAALKRLLKIQLKKEYL